MTYAKTTMEPLKPLVHDDAEQSDDASRREARAWAAKCPQVQFIAELLATLRAADPAWWSPDVLTTLWPPLTRMRWLAQRADVRQRVTTTVTGLAKHAARGKSCEFQAELLEAVLAGGDVTTAAFDAAFDPFEIAIYGNAREIWTQFKDRMPWTSDTPANQKLVGHLLRILLAERHPVDAELTRRPILTACEMREAVDSVVWQSCIPIELRVAMDDARVRWEKARGKEPYHARHDFQIVTPEILPVHVSLIDLLGVFHAAERALRFDGEGRHDSAKFETAHVSMPSSTAPSPRLSKPASAMSLVPPVSESRTRGAA
jgi:hypothetical protein